MTLVDSNVLIDIASDDSAWFDWSLMQLQSAAQDGPLIINDVIYSEVSVRYRSISEVEDLLRRLGATVVSIPRTALFIAGKVFTRYRNSGGVRTGVLPDFFIGAHADVEQLPLLTRDVTRYRTYFPAVRLIAPD